MYRVFLAEDESVVREGLMNIIPWQQCGFEFAGEASDGELALQRVRILKPDLLITDIKMPFLDGLDLCHIVHQEFPKMKIIIISGYDDFEYAQRAIREGVDQYLTKPITRRMLQEALEEVRQKLDQEREQDDYVRRFQLERQEYEQFYRRAFLEQVFSGRISIEEIYAQADKLEMELKGPCYNLILFTVYKTRREGSEPVYALDTTERKIAELADFFLRSDRGMFFRWSMYFYGVIIQGTMEDMGWKCLAVQKKISDQFENEEGLEWYLAHGKPVERFSMLSDCYHEAYHLLSYRFLFPQIHVLTEDAVKALRPEKEPDSAEQIDPVKAEPEIIKNFLADGQAGEIDDFTESYLKSIEEPMRSRMFRDYILMSAFFSVSSYLKEIEADPSVLAEMSVNMHDAVSDPDQMKKYIQELLCLALEKRDAREGVRGSRILQEAVAYIDEHYQDEDLSLNKMASQVFVSSSYFSAMFSQKMEMTFVEYVTQKRMEKAKELLRKTSLRTADIAAEVGYRDPHYFSFVFKKTLGITPREYRNEEA